MKRFTTREDGSYISINWNSLNDNEVGGMIPFVINTNGELMWIYRNHNNQRCVKSFNLKYFPKPEEVDQISRRLDLMESPYETT